jgi:TPR repeat protein
VFKLSDYKAQVIEANEALSTEDYERALSLILPLVEKSVPEALSLLGVMYQLGLGVERDGLKALELCLKALELCLKALELLSKAVDLGDGVAAHNLGTIYGMGMPNVPQDSKRSKAYYQLAKSMGFQCAPDEFYE